MSEPEGANGANHDTRERLLEAARSVFLEEGLEGARVQEIASRAGFTTGAIYANFNGKTGLIAETLSREGGGFIDTVLGAVGAGAGGGQILSDLGVGLLTGPPQLVHCVFVEAISMAIRDEAVAAELMPNLGALGDALVAVLSTASEAGVLAPELSPESVAHFCVILALGSFTIKALGAEQMSERDARLLMMALLRGLTASSTTTTD